MAVADEAPHDLRDAAGHQHMIGLPVRELPPAPSGEVSRMRSNKAGTTYGYRPNRLTGG